MSETRRMITSGVGLGKTRLNFPSWTEVLSVSKRVSDGTTPPGPGVTLWLLRYFSEGPIVDRPVRLDITVVRTGETVPWEAGEYLGSVVDGDPLDALHVWVKRETR